jgi:hypothetical protein
MGTKSPSRVRIPLSPPNKNYIRFVREQVATRTSNSACSVLCSIVNFQGCRVIGLACGQSIRPTLNYAPVAQLDRVSGYEPEGREFESLRARQTLDNKK